MATFEYRRLTEPAWDLADMTFPVYRHLMSLEALPRHPEQGDKVLVQPVAIAAMADNEPVGLALGERPADAEDGAPNERIPVMLSLFTKPDARGRGVGTALVEHLEQALRDDGFDGVQTVYMTGKPSIPVLERILEKRCWLPPEPRTVTLRFTPEEALSTPWFGRLRLPSDDYEIFPWADLSEDERQELMRSQEGSGWIAKGLEPWNHDRHSFDRVSSVGLRYRGGVVGWVINHKIAPDAVRFTCSFMRKDLGRRGRILPLYTASIERLRSAGYRTCTLVTPVAYPNMVRFVERRCAPWASFFGGTRGSIKVWERSRREVPRSG